MSWAARRLSGWLVVGAERLMPPGRAEWVRAMAAEQAHIGDHRSALVFSAGCLWAAGSERLRSLAPDARWFWPGIVLGLLLVSSAAIPGSRSWPLLWAPIGGLITVLALADGPPPCFGRAVGLATRAGLLSGLMFLASAILIVLPDAGAAGRRTGLAAAAGVMAILTMIGGAAAAPLVCRPPGARGSSAEEK